MTAAERLQREINIGLQMEYSPRPELTESAHRSWTGWVLDQVGAAADSEYADYLLLCLALRGEA